MPSLAELKKKADELRRTLNKIDAAMGQSRDRSRDIERKSKQRAEGSTVEIPEPEDMARRLLLEADDIAWLMHYFGEDSGVRAPFTYSFTEQQRDMITAIGDRIRYGGDKSLAASRGEGKTTICERMIIKHVLQGNIPFALLCCSTGYMAKRSLSSIQSDIHANDLLLADYPEVCVPVTSLGPAVQKAKTQLGTGKRIDNGEEYYQASLRYTWTGDELVFPGVPGSPSSHAIIATRGLDSAVRGIKINGQRVSLVVIDDPDTHETSRSEEQAKKLEDAIDKDLGGLGGQKRSVARCMLTTIQSRISASFLFTDQKKSRVGADPDIVFWCIRHPGLTSGTNT